MPNAEKSTNGHRKFSDLTIKLVLLNHIADLGVDEPRLLSPGQEAIGVLEDLNVMLDKDTSGKSKSENFCC